MSFSWLLLLPALAGILVFQGTWLTNGNLAKFRSIAYQRRLKAKVLIHRALIVTLLLSTFIVFRSTITILPDLVQGVLVCAILMLPILVYLWVVALMAPPTDTTVRAVSESEQQELVDKSNVAAESPETAIRQQRKIAASSTRVHEVDLKETEQASSSVDLKLTEQADSSKEPPDGTLHTMPSSTNAPRKSASSEHTTQTVAVQDIEDHVDEPLDTDSESVFDQTLYFDHTLSLEEQMQNIDGSVNHVDLGFEEPEGSLDDSAAQIALHEEVSQQNTMAGNNENADSEHAMATVEQQTIPATIYGELSKMVADLQKDKTKLQKLVIAQKAAIETEKQSHQKTQSMAKDAVKIMQKAREAERVAMNFARKERRKRQRLEADHADIAKQLENALSTKRIKENADI